MGGKRWPRRIAGAAEDLFDEPLWSNAAHPAGYRDGDRVVIMSAAEARYLDRCRRFAEGKEAFVLYPPPARTTRRGR